MQTAEHAAADELIRDCDIAMYQAKAGGKGRITVLDQQARAEARDKLRLVAELRDAIERREITLMYQPIFNTVDGHPVAVESLARWTHAGARADQPGHLRAAGRGERPDRRRSACSCSTRPAASSPSGTTCSGAAAPPRANVNVSALQLDDNLPGHVAAALERHGLRPRRGSPSRSPSRP